MNKINESTDKTFLKSLISKKNIVLFFYTDEDEDKYCSNIEEILKNVETDKFEYYAINIKNKNNIANYQLALDLKISSVPTLVFIKAGKIVVFNNDREMYKIVGYNVKSSDTIKIIIDELSQ